MGPRRFSGQHSVRDSPAQVAGFDARPAVAAKRPGNRSAGGGVAGVDRTELAYEILASDLGTRFTVSHFYNAAAGENGPVVYAVADSLRQTGDSLSGSGVWPLREIDLQELLAGRICLKIHTFAHPTSELRGQLIVPAE